MRGLDAECSSVNWAIASYFCGDAQPRGLLRDLPRAARSRDEDRSGQSAAHARVDGSHARRYPPSRPITSARPRRGTGCIISRRSSKGPDGRIHWRDSRLEWPVRHGFIDLVAREYHADKMMFPPKAS